MANEVIYNWKFSNSKDRSSLRYTIALSIIIWLIIWWIFTWQYILSMLVLLISWVSFYLDNNSSDETIINIQHLWINIQNRFYDYSKIESYAFFYNNDEAFVLRLFLKWTKLSFIDLKVDNSIVVDLKNIFPKYLDENQSAEFSFIDKIIKRLKL